MAAGSFEEVLKARLGEWQIQLVIEHKRFVQQLEAKYAALDLENARLNRQCVHLLSKCPDGTLDEEFVPMRTRRSLVSRRSSKMSEAEIGQSEPSRISRLSVPQNRKSSVSITPKPVRHQSRTHSSSSTASTGAGEGMLPVVPGQVDNLVRTTFSDASKDGLPDLEVIETPTRANLSELNISEVKRCGSVLEGEESDASDSDENITFAVHDAWEISRARRAKKTQLKKTTDMFLRFFIKRDRDYLSSSTV